MSELPPYPSDPVPPGSQGQPPTPPPAGPWVPPPGQQWEPPPPYQEDPLISPNFGGWWQRGFTLMRLTWRQILVLQLVVGVLTFGTQTLAGTWQSFALRDIERAANAGRDPDFATFFAGTVLLLVASMALLLVSMIATLAAVRIVVEAASGREPNLGGAVAGAARRLFPMLGWGILAGLIVLVGICGGVVGGIAGFAAPPETASTTAIVVVAAITATVGAVVAGAVRLFLDPLTVAAYATCGPGSSRSRRPRSPTSWPSASAAR